MNTLILPILFEIVNDFVYGFIIINNPIYYILLSLIPSIYYYIMLFNNKTDYKIRFMNMIYKLSLTLYFITDSNKYDYLIVFYVLNIINLGCYVLIMCNIWINQ